MPRSQARVVTDRPHRYAKQLASHLGRRIETSWDEESGEGRLVFPDGAGIGVLTAAEGALLLDVTTEAEHLDRIEDVVGRHLVRFGNKDELEVRWSRDTGEPGSTQRNTGDTA
ncbi:DUF2218 domain-containing protein [Streptomyces sp. NPDC058739]|uniref:DUF2218 domain-containing protein n=1 Tax=Streptomyces sp. NPDC058739 TaxID=3346618 RepID=UPI00369A6F04